MRLSHLALAFILASGHSAFAGERCQEISDVVAEAAAMKQAVIEQLRKNPQQGTLGEPWRYFLLALGSKFEALRVQAREQQYVFQTVATLSFSKKRQVDFDIFREYFYLRCRRKESGVSTVPLESIPAASLTRCWDTACSRPQFQTCMEKLLGASAPAPVR